jgi:eukaryotic-like serine/threonine-protein kinase
MSDQLGRVLGGRYRLAAAIGSGASAQVFLADDSTLRRRVAVKVLHPALAEDEAFLRRFRDEARAAAALSHPNVMAVYDWGEDDGPYLVLEYLGGGSLRALLDQGTLLTPSQALLVGLEATRALDVAHRRGFVHRDIKPANLLFGEDGRLRIADFGLARALSETAWTEHGNLVGTARYAAPEQARGGRVDGKADVYSLGLVLIEAVTGRVPLTSPEGALQTMVLRQENPVPVPDEMGVLKPILEDLGRVDPAERPEAGELGRALVAAAREMEKPAPLPFPGVDFDDDITMLDDFPDSADDLTRLGRTDATGIIPAVPPRRRRRWPWLLLAILVAAAVAAAGFVVFQQLAVPSAAVPNVVTLPMDQAEARINAADRRETDVEWELRERQVYNDNVEAGLVISQDPGGGQDLDDGGTITIVVSRGAHPVDLPDMDSATLDAAKAALEEAELEVGNIEPQFHETIPEGTLITWKVNGEERPGQAPKHSKVDLVVSSGPQPREIPSLTGSTEADARAKLEGLGLKTTTRQDYSDTVESGKVIGTSPAAGQQAKRGDTVTIIVSKGPDLVTVPDVARYSTLDQAEAALEAAGLHLGEVSGRGTHPASSDPAAGQRVKRGTYVDVFLRR